MHFEDAEIEQHSSTPNNKSKVLGVIVLTDNRQHSPTHKHRTQKEFRGSGYKGTVHPRLRHRNRSYRFARRPLLLSRLKYHYGVKQTISFFVGESGSAIEK